MVNRPSPFGFFSQRTAFLIVFVLVTLVLVGTSFGTVSWIASRLRAFATPPTTSPIFTNYDPGGAHIRPESLVAMQEYIAANPEPQNVQILTGMTTSEIAGYMVSHVSGGLKVDCTYCHILTDGNFANEDNPNKAQARVMMRMAAELNQEWVSQLQQSVGTKQITCATCHNGRPVFQTYPAEIQNTQPDDFRLPLDLQFPGGLTVTGREDKSLEDVALNQQTMYHMNVSLGVGCTFCHNARYFPSNEVAQKAHATLMIQMVQDLDRNPEYTEAMNGQVPSCYTCHQGANLPPGSANRPEDVPAVLSTNPPPEARLPATCLLCNPEQADTSGAAGGQANKPDD
jgi:photosynthetic reaction center cytochrome c subunit